MPKKNEIEAIKKRVEDELFNSIIPFWKQYSPDKYHGGYYNCLDRDGMVYDTTKYIWLLARQVWMFSKLYNKVEKRDSWLNLAGQGMDFLRRYAVAPNRRVYFTLREDGKPVYMQRKIFSECFYTMALAEYARASDKPSLLIEAEQQLSFIMEISHDPVRVGREKLQGQPGFKPLAVPMILLNVIEVLVGADFARYLGEVKDLIKAVKKHFINGKVYENILPEGKDIHTAEGRLLNPGHAIEAGWFLMHWADRLKDSALITFAGDMIRASYDIGWDNEYGGIFYFLDAEGYSPVQLEWDMKLWWVHCEAMYATLLLYYKTRATEDWRRFKQVYTYTIKHFPDMDYGEWYGYLNRRGETTHRFKGGPYKGFFHIPRALLYSLEILNRLLEDENE